MGFEVEMTLYNIRYRFRKVGPQDRTSVISDSIILDEETAQDFLAELRNYLETLENMPISANAKVKKVKYFIKVYQFVDLSRSMKTITIDAARNPSNGKGTITMKTDLTPQETFLDTDIKDSDPEQLSGSLNSVEIIES